MIGCVLRVGGPDFDVDAFLEDSPFEPCAVFHQEEVHSLGRTPSTSSSFNLDVSDGDLPQQIVEAIAFLKSEEHELRRLLAFPGVEGHLDFGIARRDSYTQSDFFPPELIRLAGALGLGIELSQYPVVEDDSEESPKP